MKKFFDWILRSSENPKNFALTAKGILGTVISIILFLSPLIHLDLKQDQLTALGDAVIQGLLAIFSLGSIIATVVGLVRKIHLSGQSPSDLSTLPVTLIQKEQPPVTIPPTPVAPEKPADPFTPGGLPK